MIYLAIVDGSRVFADALAIRLGSEPDIRVLRSATGALALVQALDHSPADVVLGDAALFDPASVATGRPGTATGSSRPAIVLLAEDGDVGIAAAAVRSGIRGWVPRNATTDELITAIREAAQGGTWIPPTVLTVVLGELVWAQPGKDPDQALLDSLTPREREVLSCLGDGLGRPEVAAHLTLSTNTVRTHVQSILGKLGVSSSLAAVAMARRVALACASSSGG